MKIGIIGCGNIVGQYIQHSAQFTHILQIVAVADMDAAKAKEAAEKLGNPALAVPVDQLLADPEIELVINLTPPKAHFIVAERVLTAGKHVYNEKPLAITREEAQSLMALAESTGLRIGCAPDTFLGAGIQTALSVINQGLIGVPVAAFAQMAGHGMESWHPNPEFFYQFGGGPMFDIGPYILTALIVLMGPIKRVTGSAKISFPERIITATGRIGISFPVEVPTHITGVLDFAQGATATIITSFDMWPHNLPKVEIYGSLGTLSVPDPNQFSGEVKMWRRETGKWEDVPLLEARHETGRIIGVADMAQAIEENRPHRANGSMAYHVLDTMHAIHEASSQGQHIELNSSCDRPMPLTDEL
jgi:predicted dehydrogenase